ncbi:hypothetical protein [Spirosoma areae]
MNNSVITFQSMKDLYPDEWVLIGNPVLTEPDTIGSIASKLIAGVLLFHSTDKREVAQKAKDVRARFQQTACVFTGEPARNRKFWL